ncbi:MAG: hypothetical protein PWP27_603 [Clostridiales bacterium]|nr:hypothetical protein [Clostridiales bacterium]
MKKFIFILIFMFLIPNIVYAYKPSTSGILKYIIEEKLKQIEHERKKIEKKMNKRLYEEARQKTKETLLKQLHDENLDKEDLENFEQLLDKYSDNMRKYLPQNYTSYIEELLDKIDDPDIILWEHEKLQKFLNNPKTFDLDEIIETNKNKSNSNYLVPTHKEHGAKWIGDWFRWTKSYLKEEWQNFVEENEKKPLLEMFQKTSPFNPGSGRPLGF